MEHPDITTALRILRRDSTMARLVQELPQPDTQWEGRRKNLFESLVRSIIFQQLSGTAARAIHTRLLTLFSHKKITPKTLLALTPTMLRACGISGQKVVYLHSLAEYFTTHPLSPRSVAHISSTNLIDHLTEIKGVGEWTVHMLLIFTLHRLDILPTGDLGVRKGMQIAYNLDHLPSKKEMEHIAEAWRAYASIASLYLWALADKNKLNT